MKNKGLFILILIVVFCTERLQRIFYVGFFDLYPARVLFIMMLVYFSYNSFNRVVSREVKSIFKVSGIFLFIVFLSIFKSDDFFYSFKKWLDSFTLFSFTILTYSFFIASAENLSFHKLYNLFLKYFKYVIFICFIGSLFLIRQINDGGTQRVFLGIPFNRRIGLFLDANFFCSFLVLAFFIIYFSKLKERLVYIILICISIFLTGSKGGLFSLTLTLLLYYREKLPIIKNTFFVYFLFICIVGCLVFSMIFPIQVIELITNLSVFKGEYGSQTILPRLLVWHSGMKALIENPLLGIGPGNIVNISKAHSIAGLIDYMSASGFYGLGYEEIDKLATHSSYLEILFESGIIAFALYIIFLIKTLNVFLKASKLCPSVFLGFTLGFISFYLTVLLISYNTYYMSFLTGLYLFLYDRYKKYVIEEQNKLIMLK